MRPGSRREPVLERGLGLQEHQGAVLLKANADDPVGRRCLCAGERGRGRRAGGECPAGECHGDVLSAPGEAGLRGSAMLS